MLPLKFPSMGCSISSPIALPVLFRWTKSSEWLVALMLVMAAKLSWTMEVQHWRLKLSESMVCMFFLLKCVFLGWILVCCQNGKKLARLLQLILVNFITFIILDDTSKLCTLEGRFLNDSTNSKLFKEPESDAEHKAMRTVLVYRAVTKYVMLKNTLVYKI